MPDRHIEFISRALITRGSQILLCRNLAAGYHFLPGGHVEFGESAAAAVIRELREEGDLDAHAEDCLFVHENTFEVKGKRHHEVNVVFHVKLLDEEPPITSIEPKIALEWVDLATLHEIDLRPAAMKAWLISGAHGGAATWASTVE